LQKAAGWAQGCPFSEASLEEKEEDNMSYGNLGLGALSGALGELDDAIVDLSGFGEIAQGAAKVALPVLVGGGLAFGSAYAIDKLDLGVSSTAATIKKYKWAVSGALGVLGGLAMYKYAGATAGVTTMATAATVALVGWGMGKLTPGPIASEVSGYRMAAPQPVYGKYTASKPQPIFGAYSMTDPKPIFGGISVLPGGPGVGAGFKAVNPGVFG